MYAQDILTIVSYIMYYRQYIKQSLLFLNYSRAVEYIVIVLGYYVSDIHLHVHFILYVSYQNESLKMEYLECDTSTANIQVALTL